MSLTIVKSTEMSLRGDCWRRTGDKNEEGRRSSLLLKAGVKRQGKGPHWRVAVRVGVKVAAIRVRVKGRG